MFFVITLLQTLDNFLISDLVIEISSVENWSTTMRNAMTTIYGEAELRNLMNGWLKCMIEIKDSRNGDICRELISKIVAPTMILHGARDPLVPPYHYHYLHRSIKNSK